MRKGKGTTPKRESSSQDAVLPLPPGVKLLRTLREHANDFGRIAWSPNGRVLATVSLRNAIRLWNAETGECLRTLTTAGAAFSSVGWCVAFDPTGRTLASADDDVVELWDPDSGQLLRELEGHTSIVTAVAFDPTGRTLASAGGGTLKLWDPNSGQLLCSLETHGGDEVRAVAFDPTGRTLASADDDVVEVWDPNSGQLLRELEGHTSIVTAVAFDPSLAGQPDYRLIHALFLDDADLALVLFDPTDSRDPLHGVEFWLKQLKVGQPSLRSESLNLRDACRIVLVAARADRGTATLTREELDAYCHQRGIPPHISTSAKEGEGIEELIVRMQTLIRWDEKPPTITTDTFKRVKDHVLALKENREEKQVIVSPQALRQRLMATDADWRFNDAELMTAVGHLENHGYVQRLRTSKGETRILLAPELLNNLAASYVLEARRNEKGLGSLEEKRLLAGEYPFRELEGLSPGEHEVLLDSAALLFLEHHVCFRQTDPLSSQSYLIFPDLINLKKPAVEEEQPTDEGVAYTVNGAVENVYASLVVLLGYTHTFTRTDQWRNQARYEVGRKLVCGFRLDAERDGELDFVLYFGLNVGRPVRTLFEGLFESFLARRNLTVFRYEPVACSKGHPLNRAVVREQLNGGANFAFCPKCGERLQLPNTDEPIQLTRDQQAQVDVQRRVADLRTRFEQCIFRVQTYVEEQGIQAPECFISYAWGDPDHERWVERNLATDLQKAGMDVVLDRWENARIGSSVSRFVERIDKCDRIIVVGTPLYRKKYENKDTSTGYVVAAEVDVISNRLLGTEPQKETVLPLLLAGEKTSSLPPLLQGRVYGDFRDEQAYFTIAFDLILSLYQIPPNDRAVADLRESLRGTEMN